MNDILLYLISPDFLMFHLITNSSNLSSPCSSNITFLLEYHIPGTENRRASLTLSQFENAKAITMCPDLMLEVYGWGCRMHGRRTDRSYRICWRERDTEMGWKCGRKYPCVNYPTCGLYKVWCSLYNINEPCKYYQTCELYKVWFFFV